VSGVVAAAPPGWEGTALLVVGPAQVLAQARHAASGGIPPAAP
jgi:hypothetical protein